jgi:hypothetical protein
MTRHTLTARLAALAIAISSVGSAQPRSPQAPVAREAQAEFAHGERAFAAGDYARALRHFQNAERLAPHPLVRFNIAICLDKLGRLREAIELYERLAADGELADSTRSEAAGRATQAAAALATLQIDGPRGAQAVVDDRDRCRIPCAIKLDPGEHVLRAQGSPESRRILLETGQELRVDLPGKVVAAAQAPRTAAPSAEDGGQPLTDRDRFGALSYIGGSVAILGLGVFTYYGIRTVSLHQDYLDNPDPDTREQGIRARTTANVALGVALVGTALVIVDWATSSRSSSAPSARAPRRDGSRPVRSLGPPM